MYYVRSNTTTEPTAAATIPAAARAARAILLRHRGTPDHPTTVVISTPLGSTALHCYLPDDTTDTIAEATVDALLYRIRADLHWHLDENDPFDLPSNYTPPLPAANPAR